MSGAGPMLTMLLGAVLSAPLPVAQPVGNPNAWISPDDYPPAAVRAQEQGRVAFRLYVLPDGTAGRCEITQASGSATLDAATCPLLMRRARFRAGRAATKSGFAGVYANAVSWRIPDDLPPIPVPPPVPPGNRKN